MLHGHITRLEPALGFGWLVDDAGMDWFFVQSGIREQRFAELTKGARVTFQSESTATGPRASDIALEYPLVIE